jgi:hypothetical protein
MKNLYWYIIVILTIGFFTYYYVSDNIEKSRMLENLRNDLNNIELDREGIKDSANEAIITINKNKEDKKSLQDSLENFKTELNKNTKTNNKHLIKDTVYSIDTIFYKKEEVELLIIKN